MPRRAGDGHEQHPAARGEGVIGGSAKIVLDLKDLTYIDSMGIGSLVRLYVSAKSSGWSLKAYQHKWASSAGAWDYELLTVFGTAEDHNLPVH